MPDHEVNLVLTKGEETILEMVKECNGNQSEAARRLGITRSYVNRIVRKIQRRRLTQQ